jgi:hypothetical protein
MGLEKSKKMKNIYREKFTGNTNPSKKDEVKIKKNQIIINFKNLYEFAKNKGFELNSLFGENKNSKLNLTCANNHTFDINYHNFYWKHKNTPSN